MTPQNGTPVDVRLTPQRQAVLSVLRATPDHPTAAEIYQRVRIDLPGIGAATVYRALAVLVEAGQARELQLGDRSAARYDANTDRHDHVVCDSCGAAVDIDAPVPEGLPAAAAATSGFRVTSVDLRFHGTCPACQHVAPAPAGGPAAVC